MLEDPFQTNFTTRTGQMPISEDLATAAESTRQADEGILAPRFWESSWWQRDGEMVRIGAVLPRAVLGCPTGVRLPDVGDVAYRGLPLMGVRLPGGLIATTPAPLSGVVESVNEGLAENPTLLRTSPCSDGWAAVLRPTRLDEEAAATDERFIILFSSDAERIESQRNHLRQLGCHVIVVRSAAELATVRGITATGVLLLNSQEWGPDGAAAVGVINEEAPGLKVVVAASTRCCWEKEYRSQRVFYYAVEPFADDEIRDILDSAFRPCFQRHVRGLRVSRVGLQVIATTGLEGQRVRLLAEPGLLAQSRGLGRMIRDELVDHRMPVETVPGVADFSPEALARQAATCDRLVLLTMHDTGRLPGSLFRDSRRDVFPLDAEAAGKTIALVLQPAAEGLAESPLCEKAVGEMAKHIVREMIS
jgi:glycine cleavage system H lipoate-binding protein